MLNLYTLARLQLRQDLTLRVFLHTNCNPVLCSIMPTHFMDSKHCRSGSILCHARCIGDTCLG